MSWRSLVSLITLLAVVAAGCSFGQPVATTAPPPTPRPTSVVSPYPGPISVEASPPGPEIQPKAVTEIYPTVTIPQNYPAGLYREVSLPVNYASNSFSIRSMTFSLVFDTNRLTFISNDNNQDGLPDSILLGTAAGFAVQFRYETQGSTGLLHFGVSDLISPFKPIPSGVLLSVKLIPRSTGSIPVPFSTNDQPAFYDLQGQPIPGQGVSGSLLVTATSGKAYLPVIFNKYPPTYAIRGRVTENGQAKDSVLLQIQTGQLAWSDAYGYFLIQNLSPGVYSLLPSAAGYTFSPPSRIISLPPESNNQDFFAIKIVPTSTSPRPPTPTPSQVRCEERIFNGGFETNGGWVIPNTSYPAGFVAQPVFQGARAMRTGIPNSWENRISSSWFYQEFVIPFNARSVVLKLHIYNQTGEGSISTSSDRQSVRLLNQSNQVIANLIGPNLGNQRYWMFYQFDLRNFTGQALRLAFETYNDGIGSITLMFVDNVSLMICY